MNKETISCKWCEKETPMLGTKMCDGCWELSTRIELDLDLAEKMLAHFKSKKQIMLFKGIFNWYGEVHVLYTRAKNKDIAFNNFITQLSKILERSRSIMYLHFKFSKNIDNWSIKEEKEV